MTDDSYICGAECGDGSPCQRGATEEDGRCYQHSGDASDTHRREYDPERVAEAIRSADGTLSDASDILGCARQTVHDYVNSFDVCQQARDEARDELVDLARSTYRDILEDDEAEDRDKLKAADSVTDKYDDETEPDKVSGPDGDDAPLMVIKSDE
jgi:hypothetical protein